MQQCSLSLKWCSSFIQLIKKFYVIAYIIEIYFKLYLKKKILLFQIRKKKKIFFIKIKVFIIFCISNFPVYI